MKFKKYFCAGILLPGIFTHAIAQSSDPRKEGELLMYKGLEFIQRNEFDSAFVYFSKSSALGNTEGTFNLGILYMFGLGTRKDESCANEYFLEAANKNHAEAQFRLGESYRQGRGVIKNFAEALKWYYASAYNGFSAAQNNLGYAFLTGEGVAANIDSSVYWFTWAARNAHTTALTSLAIIYMNDNFSRKNLAESYKWFLIANEYKDKYHPAEQQKMHDAIREIEAVLSVLQKQKAKTDAEKFTGKTLMFYDNLFEIRNPPQQEQEVIKLK
jgi:TPR repeat protein